MEKESGVVVQLGMPPRYLDQRCHEVLYEIDLGSMSHITEQTLTKR
ncbi:MAG TPA: hypothetical protein VFU48_04100 [Nitrospira sp.]|nr:hypothetical protein [Nitrospira sp.]